MRPSHPGVLAVILLASLSNTPAAAAPEDPVDLLQRLTNPAVDWSNPAAAGFRAKKVKQHLADLKNVRDLRRALEMLEEIQTNDERELAYWGGVRDEISGKLEKQLQGLLKHKDVTRRRAAAVFLVTFSGRESPGLKKIASRLAPEVVALVEDKDLQVRVAAARTLGTCRADLKVVIPALDKLLRATTVEDRRAAVDSLAQLPRQIRQGTVPEDPEVARAHLAAIPATAAAILPLAGRALADDDSQVRVKALAAFQQASENLAHLVPDARPAPPLLEEGRPPTQAETGMATEYRKQCEELLQSIKALAGALGREAPAVGKALESDTEDVCVAAGTALEGLATAREKLRLYARSALGNDAAKQPTLVALDEILRGRIPSLQNLLTHKQVPCRLAALYVLETMSDQAASAAPAIVKALQDDDAFVRWGACRALGRMGSIKDAATTTLAVRGLDRLLAGPENNSDVLLTALAALEAFGPAASPAVPTLAAMLARHDVRTRTWVIRVIEVVGIDAKEAIPALISTLANSKTEIPIRRAAAGALAKFASGDPKVVEALTRALDDPDNAVRQQASAALLDRK